jgi:hypothetical protein
MATVHASDYIVEESVIEVNKTTGVPREIDIYITSKKNPEDKTMVECRDWKSKQDIIWIDQLDGKARSLGIKKIVAVSSSGFYKTTLREANSRGIETMHVREAEKKDWSKWLFRIKKFGINIDFEPKVKKVNLVSPNDIIRPDLSKVNPNNVFLINLNDKKKISLYEYLKGLVKDPKIVAHVRANNTDEAISHYDYTVPCDRGVGYSVDGKTFIPLLQVIISFDSIRRTYKIPMRHILAGKHKLLVGKENIMGSDTRIVLEERKGQLVVMLENQAEKTN